MPKPIYGIFEGGGAKGLGHIAGLKAAERNDLEFIGVAGASAGALIAALVSVGYGADELFDPDTPGTNLLNRHGITPLSLIGLNDWNIFARAQKQAAGTMKAGLFGGVIAAWLRGRRAVHVAREVRTTGGYFTTEIVRKHLNDFLYRKLRQHHANAGRTVTVPPRVRFQDIDPTLVPECCSLKIIVTDITNRRMVVFENTAEFADVEVAEAVAASIAIPAVFKPARIPSFRASPGALYADGGLVSNLPIWVFAEEKLNYERVFLPNSKVPILAFSLADDGTAPVGMFAPGTLDYWTAVGRSAVFGGQAVARRLIADVRQIAMPIRLGVTEFDFTTERALDAYYDAYVAAAQVIVREMDVRPREIERLLGNFHAATLAMLPTRTGAPPPKVLRVSLLQPDGTISFRVTHSFNTRSDADDRLVFSRVVQGGPAAFESRAPAFVDFAAMFTAGVNPNMTKYEFAMLPRHLVSAICLPIFSDIKAWAEPDPASRPVPVGVVSIDSDADLTQIYGDPGAMQQLAKLSVGLGAALQP